MRKLNRRFVISLAVALGLGIGTIASSQSFMDLYHQGNVIAKSQTDDVSVSLLIKYVGANSATVTVEADGNLTFKSGTSGAEAADTSLECPVSGGLGGIIDVSDAACNTVGEVLDIINASGSWIAVPVDALRTDSSDNTFVTKAEGSAKTVAGYSVLRDSIAVSFKNGIALTSRDSIDKYMTTPTSTTLKNGNPFLGQRTYIRNAAVVSNYDSGTASLVCYSVLFGPLNSSGSYTETVTTIFSKVLAATDVNNSLAAETFGYWGLPGRQDEKVICRAENSADMDTVTFYALGVEVPLR